MKKVLVPLLVLVMALVPVLSSCSSTSTSTSATAAPSTTIQPTTSISSPSPTSTTQVPSPTSTVQPPSSSPATSSIITGGTLMMKGRQLPKNIGYQPTMQETDRVGIEQAVAETLMNINSEGQLVPELATSVDTDPVAKTLTWHLRQGVQFQDGTPFNAQAAAWNFQQMKDAGTLQYGDQVTGMEVMDPYTLRFTLKTFSYIYVQVFSTNVYMFSPTAIEKNGKEWAITHVYGTGPFIVKSFDPTSKIVLVKNPNYWRPGLPYLDGLEQDFSLDSAVNSAAIQSNEIQIFMGGDLVLQKELVAKGYHQFRFTPNPTVEFLVPSSDDPNSPLSNPLVREAIEYAIDRNAICQGVWQGTATALEQMAYKGAVGYDPANNWSYDPAKAKQLLEQAGYPGGKGISISIYVPNPAPLVALCTAIAGYLQQVGIDAQVVPQTFALHTSQQAQGWQNGLFYLRDPGSYSWPSTILNWFGPKPTYNPNASMGRPDGYDQLANQALTAQDATTLNSIVTQLVQMIHDNSMIIPIDSQLSTWVSQPFVNTEQAMSNRGTFDWATVWTEKP